MVHKEGMSNIDIKHKINLTIAQEHLENAPDLYLEAINKNSPEELEKYIEKIKSLQKYLNAPKRVLSIGIGSGIELKALKKIFSEGTEILGLDISINAIDTAYKNLGHENIKTTLMQGSITNMPTKIKNKKVDGIVLSSLLHEVYSYAPNGQEAWEKAIKETVCSLSEGGFFMLRDFASFPVQEKVILSFKSLDSKFFYQYFREYYRSFRSWKEDISNQFNEKGKLKVYYPKLDKNTNEIEIGLNYAVEMMLHYRVYLKSRKKGIINKYDPAWKEIDECYLIPDIQHSNYRVIMTPERYKERIMEIADKVLFKSGYKLICVEDKISIEFDRSKVLKDSFEIRFITKNKKFVDSLDLVSRKIEFLFKKIKK